jgi:hypothetical protein
VTVILALDADADRHVPADVGVVIRSDHGSIGFGVAGPTRAAIAR